MFRKEPTAAEVVALFLKPFVTAYVLMATLSNLHREFDILWPLGYWACVGIVIVITDVQVRSGK